MHFFFTFLQKKKKAMQQSQETSDFFYIQPFDIETTGAKLSKAPPCIGADCVFAIGSAVLQINIKTCKVTVLERRRWVLEINPRAQSGWADLWKTKGYEMVCWNEFWHKHDLVLTRMMTETAPEDLFSDEGKMIASFAKYLQDTEDTYRKKGLTRVYDTVGFDVSNLDDLLQRHGHTAIFLWRPPQCWPCNVSYLKMMRNHAFGISPFRAPTPEQEQAIDNGLRSFVPVSVVHDHDPANDALSIGYKWTFFALQAHANVKA